MGHGDGDLWVCPLCGEKFVTANMAHSCGTFDFQSLFAGCEPHVWETYKALEKMALEVAPFHVIPQRTRVSFQLRTRCAGGTPMKKAFRFAFVSRTPIEHPRVVKVETFAPDQHVVYVLLHNPSDVDGQVRKWLKLSIEYGEQKNARTQR